MNMAMSWCPNQQTSCTDLPASVGLNLPFLTDSPFLSTCLDFSPKAVLVKLSDKTWKPYRLTQLLFFFFFLWIPLPLPFPHPLPLPLPITTMKLSGIMGLSGKGVSLIWSMLLGWIILNSKVIMQYCLLKTFPSLLYAVWTFRLCNIPASISA